MATFNVTSAPYNATGDGTTDDIVAIQAAFTAAHVAGGTNTVLLPVPSVKYLISNSIKVYSNTTISAVGATIYLKDGSNTAFLVNANPFANTDTAIDVEGGIWDANLANNPGPIVSDSISPVTGIFGHMNFVGMSDITVNNVTLRHCVSFAIQTQGSTQAITNITFDACGLDGVHINGPSDHITITNISGQTGDDFVALNAWDWLPTQTFGDITDVVITTLRPNPSTWAVIKMQATSTANIARVAISDVLGTSTNSGITAGYVPDANTPAHTALPGTISGVTVDNYSVTVSQVNSGDGYTYGYDMQFLPVTLNGFSVTNYKPGGRGIRFEPTAQIVSASFPPQAADPFDALILSKSPAEYRPGWDGPSTASAIELVTGEHGLYQPINTLASPRFSGAALFAAGRFAASGKVAAYFDGTGYINLGRPIGLQFTGKITIEADIVIDALPTSGANWAIFSTGFDGSNEGVNLRLVESSGTVYLQCLVYDGSNHFASAAVTLTDIPARTATRVFGRYDGTNWTVGINGVVKGTSASGVGQIAVASPRVCLIGAEDTNGTINHFFAGTIGRVAIYPTNLSDASLLANATFAMPSPLIFTSDGSTPLVGATVWFTSDSSGLVLVTGLLLTDSAGSVGNPGLLSGGTYYANCEYQGTRLMSNHSFTAP